MKYIDLDENIKRKIGDILNSYDGENIGTSLQIGLENEINNILPTGYKYYFLFNMSGSCKHLINGEEI